MHRVYTLSEGRPEFDNVRYVGQTSQKGDRRWKEHLRKGHNPHLLNWIAKCKRLGTPILCQYIEACNSKADLDDAEKFWIAKYREWGYRLCNLSAGGEGAAGCKRTPEQCKKMSERAKRQFADPENRKKQSKRAKGVPKGPFSLEHCKHMSEAQKGKKHRPTSPETRKRLSEVSMGVPKSLEHCKHLSEANSTRAYYLKCCKGKYFGVHSSGKKWIARYKCKYLGTFDTEALAARAYNAVAPPHLRNRIDNIPVEVDRRCKRN